MGSVEKKEGDDGYRCLRDFPRGMTRRDFAGAAGLGAFSVALGGCQLLGLEWRYRYRLTAEVVRGGERYRGSSVIEVIRERGPTGIGGKARGEAAAVDIPGAGTLFLLLRSEKWGADWPFIMPHHAFQEQLGSVNMVDAALLTRLSSMNGAKVVLSPEFYPQLVRFRDIRDPKSVELVDSGNLATSFGFGVALGQILVELTPDPVTQNIGKELPWLGAYPETRLDREYKSGIRPNLSQRLADGDFRQ